MTEKNPSLAVGRQQSLPRLALAASVSLIIGYLIFLGVIAGRGGIKNSGEGAHMALIVFGVIGLFCIGAVLALALSITAVVTNYSSVKAWVALVISSGEVITMVIMMNGIYHLH